MPTIHDERPKLEALKSNLEREGPMETIRLSGFAPLMPGAQAADAQGRSWIEVMPVAEKAKNGPHYFTITAEDLQAAVAYIQANPDRIPVDYDHSGSEGGSTKAAGWFTGNAEVRGSSLWAEVAWTPQAVQEIRDGVFRFVSPEWAMEHKDAKTGLWTKFKELAAATLTNRPFFSEMAAVKARESGEDVGPRTLLAKAILAGLPYIFEWYDPPVEESVMVGAEHDDVLDFVCATIFPSNDVADVIRAFLPAADSAAIEELLAHNYAEGTTARIDAIRGASATHDSRMPHMAASITAVARTWPDRGIVRELLPADLAGPGTPRAAKVRRMELLKSHLAGVITELGGPDFVLPSPDDVPAALEAVFLHQPVNI